MISFDNKILILDGAMGTMIQKHGLTEEDYHCGLLAGCAKELKGNSECLNLTRPDVIKSIHKEYIAAGADIIETNTFSANMISQAEYGCEEFAEKMAYEGARIAREAADEAAEAEDDKKKKDAITPNKKAKFYIYLSSASWCGPCKALMPKVAEQYKAMQKKKVEVILISCDRTIEEGRQYLQHYKADFCGVMAGEAADKELPGYKAASSIPYAIVVDKKGKVITAGNGASIFADWKNICK